VKCGEVLKKVKKGKEYHTYNQKKESMNIGHMLRRNCLLKQVVDGKIDARI
jgi:hypothetical protein